MNLENEKLCKKRMAVHIIKLRIFGQRLLELAIGVCTTLIHLKLKKQLKTHLGANSATQKLAHYT